MPNHMQIAQQLYARNLHPSRLDKSFKPEDLFLTAYCYYLLSLSNENTKRHYKIVIDHFVRFLRNVTQITPLNAIGADILLWKTDLELTGGVGGVLPGGSTQACIPHEKASLQNKISIISAFYKFLQKPGLDGSPPLVAINPVDALHQRVAVEKYSRSKKISIESLNKILAQINTKTLNGLRDFCLIYGYFVTGRRNSEWLQLQWKNLNFNRNPPTYSFIRKGQKEMNDELPEKLQEHLIAYLTKRWGADFNKKILPETYLFTAIPGKGGARQLVDPNQPLAQRSMLRIMKKLAKKAGLDPTKISVHSLRHLHAESYLKAGASAEEIRARLGHQSLATTQRYMSSMTNEANRLAAQLDEMLNSYDIDLAE